MSGEETVPTRQNNRVSSFILASQQANVRLPPAESLPPQPREMHRYIPVDDASAPEASESSSILSIPTTIREETSAELELEQRASTRSVHFEDQQPGTAQGFLSKMYSAIVDKGVPKHGRPLKPALKNMSKAESGEHATSKAGNSSRHVSDPEDAIAAMSKPTILDKGKDKAADVHNLDLHASGQKDDYTVGGRLS